MGPSVGLIVSSREHVPNIIESHGTIEIICTASILRVGDTVTLVFRALDDSDPPYNCRVIGPTGTVIVERIIRDLPTGKPQSAPPVVFSAAQDGVYRLEITQLYGRSKGWATLTVLPVDSDDDSDP